MFETNYIAVNKADKERVFRANRERSALKEKDTAESSTKSIWANLQPSRKQNDRHEILSPECRKVHEYEGQEAILWLWAKLPALHS